MAIRSTLKKHTTRKAVTVSRTATWEKPQEVIVSLTIDVPRHATEADVQRALSSAVTAMQAQLDQAFAHKTTFTSR